MNDKIEKNFSSRMLQSDLDKLIKAHEDYIRGVKGGKRLILQFMNLSGLNFSKRNISDSVLTGSALIQADLSGTVMDRCNLFGCDMRFANMEGASLVKADLRGVCARGARMSNADMLQADLREGQMLAYERSGELQTLYIDIPAPATEGRTDFSKAKMTRVRLNEAQAGRADFSEADMSMVRMRNANMRGANFTGANLENGDLTGSDLSNANIKDAIIMGAQMQQTKLENVDLNAALNDKNFKKLNTLEQSLDELVKKHQTWVDTAGKEGESLDLSGFDMRNAVNLRTVKLTALRAEKAVFVGMNLTGIELQHAQLDGADLRSANAQKSDFRGASLKEAKFARADLNGANFQPLVMDDGTNKITDLSGANLRYADLRNADFKKAILKGADISFARITDADFTGADLADLVTEGVLLELAKGTPDAAKEDAKAE